MSLVTSLLYCYEAPQFASVQRKGNESDAEETFVLLGRFDQLVLRVSNRIEDAVFRPGAGVNARVASSCACLGHLVKPSVFSPKEWAGSHPLLGYCSVRLARKALKAAGNFDFLFKFLEKKLSAENLDLKWSLISGTGWEDVTVLFFGKSFNTIKRAIGILRSINAEDTRDSIPNLAGSEVGLHHLIVTSCTLPGIALPPWDRDWTEKCSESFLTNVEADEPLRWAIRVESHPGHWDAFVRLLREKADEMGMAIELAPLFGQADIRVVPSTDDGRTHRGLIRFLTEVIFQLEAMDKTVVRTVETRLIPELDKYGEDAEAGFNVTRTRPRTTSKLEEFRLHSRPALTSMGAPPHTISALEETLRRIEGMAWDPLHGEEFSSIRAIADSFVKFTGQAYPRADEAQLETEAREILRDISEWQMQVERCLADRFRGSYPAGDSLMVRLGSYPGAHHRFLVVMDHFAQRIYDIARDSINRHLSSRTFKEAALTTFIGNSPTAYAVGHLIRRLGCGFTDVPAHMVARLQDTHVVAHETGHHFYRAFQCSCPNTDAQILEELTAILTERSPGMNSEEVKKLAEDRLEQGIQREIREIFAELFASHICFPGIPEEHENAAYRTIKNYYTGITPDNFFYRSVLMDCTLRLFAVRSLIATTRDEEGHFDVLVDDFMAKLGVQPDANPRICERVSSTRDSLILIGRLRRNHESFKSLMGAFADCANARHFPEDNDENSFLRTYRDMMMAPPESEAQSLACLDRLWFILLRTQAGLLS